MNHFKSIIVILIFAMYSLRGFAQNQNCDSIMLNQAIVNLHNLTDTSNLVLFYRSNGISIHVPKRQILLRKNELDITEQAIYQRFTFIESGNLRYGSQDFKFTDKAFYMARRYLDTGKCIVYYDHREIKSVKRVNYRYTNCVKYVRYLFEPGVFLQSTLVN